MKTTSEIHACPVCNTSVQPIPFDEFVRCSRCGPYNVSDGRVLEILGSGVLSPHERAVLSSWIFEQNRTGFSPKLTDAFVSSISRIRIPTIPERAKRLLEWLVEKTTPANYGSYWSINDEPACYPLTYSSSPKELDLLVQLLASDGYVDGNARDLRITPQGFTAAEALSIKQRESNQGFVAMWFDHTMTSAFSDGLAKGIDAAGYRALRIDRKDHNNKIDDEIIAEIRRSKFLVADYTGNRGGVYYEAGFARGLGLEVFSTCRKSEMSNLHFDVRQYNTIDWDSPEELAERLRLRIEAVLGDGPLKNR